MRRPRRHPGGWFIIDALLAMGVIVILAATLAAAMSSQRKAEARLAATRESIRLAEQTLVALQAAQPAPQVGEGVTIQVESADNSAAAPAGWHWVTVTVTHDGRKTTLAGLAPAGGVQ